MQPLAIAAVLLFLLPAGLVCLSNRVTGANKLWWVVLTAALSWFGYAAFEWRFREGLPAKR